MILPFESSFKKCVVERSLACTMDNTLGGSIKTEEIKNKSTPEHHDEDVPFHIMFAILSLDYGIAHNLLCLVTWLQRTLAFHSHSYHSRRNVRAGHRGISCDESNNHCCCHLGRRRPAHGCCELEEGSWSLDREWRATASPELKGLLHRARWQALITRSKLS